MATMESNSRFASEVKASEAKALAVGVSPEHIAALKAHINARLEEVERGIANALRENEEEIDSESAFDSFSYQTALIFSLQ